MSKDETPPPAGLLSRVVRFVRNPKVNWSEPESLETERESQYSKQMLKDMLERKRRNDVVRRREFDQLRKLRQRGTLNDEPRITDLPARTSMFHNSIASSDERAVTIRKIDEIEEQMSRQWWKAPGAVMGPAALAGTSAAGPGHAATVPAFFASTTPLPLPEFPAAGADAVLPALLPEFVLGPASAVQTLASGQSLQPRALVPFPEAVPLEKAVPAYVHDPDLEEAAIRFANGDSAGAEASLQETLAQHTGEPAPAQFELWMALFDLYRATGQQERFDTAGLEFAARFHRSGPLWFSLPEQLGLGAALPGDDPAKTSAQRVWSAPPQLTLQSVAALQAWLERNAAPWTMAWGRLDCINEDALKALAALFSLWAVQPVHLVFTEADRLETLLQSHTVSGERGNDPQWWQLRMATLHCMNQPDAFEMVALDYCVTYEVSPPSWQVPQCSYQDASQAMQGSHSAIASTTEQTLASAASHWGESTHPLTLPGDAYGAVALPGLEGQIEGDASTVLEALAEARALANAESGPLRIPCERLIRLDFAAAGSVLNWAARQHSLGRTLRFERLHRLVAVFFNVIGINEYAVVQPRED